MSKVQELLKTYENDYYLWLKGLKDCLEKEKTVEEKLEGQIREFMEYLSKSLKREFRHRFGDYVFTLFVDNTFNDKDARKRAKVLSRWVKVLVDDVPYLVVYYSKKMVNLMDHSVGKLSTMFEGFDYESMNIEEKAFQVAVQSLILDLAFLHRANIDKLLEYVHSKFTKKELEYSKFLISFPEKDKLRVRGKFNKELVKYAVEKGINYIHRELEELLVDAIINAFRLQAVDAQELWEDLNSSRLCIEGFLSYAPSLAEEMDTLFEKAKKVAKETIKTQFGTGKEIHFTFDEIMSAGRKDIAGRAKKRKK